MKVKKATVVVGGQFGSEGKGAIVGYLCQRDQPDLVIRIGGPNAGHTAYAGGKPWVFRTVPIGAIYGIPCHIAPGSEIDLDVLDHELEMLASGGIKPKLTISPQATILEESHKGWEASQGLRGKLGSTQKGIGACRADRIMRSARLAKDEPRLAALIGEPRIVEHVMIETSQGYGLGLHAGFYPFCTSTDTTVTDALAAAGICAVGTEIDPWVVLRTYPIRVAGNSGPLFKETTWDELGRITKGHIKPEQTTVTKLTRRVGMWDPDLARKAVEANGGILASVALTFFDYIFPGHYGSRDAAEFSDSAKAIIESFERDCGGAILLIGTGPDSVVEREWA